jgi:ionotropic kainate glutamate receptor 2
VLKAGLHGLTGHIEFNEGKRSNFKLDLLKLKREELRKVGHWSPSTGINITDPTAFYETSATNITLVVMTREVRIALLHCLLLPRKRTSF